MNEEELRKLHDSILNFLLEWRRKNPDFTFAPRKTDKYKRLSKGYWFQGSNYVFVGFAKKSDQNNRTSQFGLSISKNKQGEITCWGELVFKTEQNEAVNQLYKDFVKLNSDYKPVTEKDYYYETKWLKRFGHKDIFKNLESFISKDVKELYELAEKRGLLDKIKLSEKDFLKFLERINSIKNKQPPPRRLSVISVPKPKPRKSKKRTFKPREVDYLSEQQEKAKLGRLGEEAVIRDEKYRLKIEGRPDLIDDVVKKQDGEGYDIFSRDKYGNPIYIEVKTTENKRDVDFFISENEICFSELNSKYYELWRILSFDRNEKTGKVYKIKGNMRKELDLQPLNYTSRIKSKKGE